MRRVVIYLILLVLLASFASAAEVKDIKVAEGWYKYKDTFTKNGNTYSIRAVNAEEGYTNNAFLHINKNETLKMQVPFGTCEITEMYKYCFENASLEEEEVEIDPYGNLQPAIYINFIEYDLSPHIELQREYESTKLNIFEETDVTMTIENIGNVPLYNLRLSEVVPEDFEIVSAGTGFTRINNTLTANFNLFEGSIWTGTYKLRPIEFEDINYKTKIIYNTDEKSNLEFESKNQKLVVEKPYKLTFSSFSKAVDIKTRTPFEITIENLDDKEITIDNFEVQVPLGMSHVLAGNMRKVEPYRYQYSGSVDVDEEKVLSVSAFAPWEGNYTFKFTGALIVKDQRVTFRDESVLQVETDGLGCYFRYNNLSATAGQEIKYNAYIENKDDASLYNIDIELQTPFGDKEFYFENIDPDEQIEMVANEKVLLPFDLEDKKYSFNISGVYNTDNGQEFKLDCEQEYQAKKAKKLINVILEPSRRSADLGDTVRVDVIIENALDTRVEGIDVYEKDGNDSVYIEYLRGGESKTAYSYEIKVSEKEESSKISLKTIVEVKKFGYTDSGELDIIVKEPYVPQEGSDSTTEDEEDSTDSSDDKKDNGSSSKEDEEDKQPEGFFAKLIYLIKSIFS